MVYKWYKVGERSTVVFSGSILDAGEFAKEQAANVPIYEAFAIATDIGNNRFIMAHAMNMGGRIAIAKKVFSYGTYSRSTSADNLRRWEAFYSHDARFNNKVESLRKIANKFPEYVETMFRHMGIA